MTKLFAYLIALVAGFAIGLNGGAVRADEGYASAARYDAPADRRDQLSLDTLLSDTSPIDPVHYEYFLPIGPNIEAGEDLAGRLTVPIFTVFDQGLTGLGRIRERTTFPQFSASLVSQGALLLPLEHDRFLTADQNDWDIILSPGRINGKCVNF